MLWVQGLLKIKPNKNPPQKKPHQLCGYFGTGDSDLVWNALLLFDNRFNKTVSMFGGYRWLDYDYETGSGLEHSSYDVTYQGPAIALRFDW